MHGVYLCRPKYYWQVGSDNHPTVDIKGHPVIGHTYRYSRADIGPDLGLDRNPVNGVDDVPGEQEDVPLQLPSRLQHVQ